MYSRRTLPDGIKGSATGEASQSPYPGAKYGVEANRDANSNKAHRTTRRSPCTTAGGNQKRIRTSALLFFREILKCKTKPGAASAAQPLQGVLEGHQINCWTRSFRGRQKWLARTLVTRHPAVDLMVLRNWPRSVRI